MSSKGFTLYVPCRQLVVVAKSESRKLRVGAPPYELVSLHAIFTRSRPAKSAIWRDWRRTINFLADRREARQDTYEGVEAVLFGVDGTVDSTEKEATS